MKYRTTLRPVSSWTLPPALRDQWEYVEAPWEGVNRPDLPRSQHRFGVFRTTVEISAEDLKRFDIVAVP